MLISTKGRYAMRVMVDLAENNTNSYIPLKDIAERQGISQKYLESIMSILSKADFVDSLHGKGGGYRLNRDPADYTAGSVLKLTEGSLAPVACLDKTSKGCENAGSCKTLGMWTELGHLIDDYLEGITIGDLAANIPTDDYII